MDQLTQEQADAVIAEYVAQLKAVPIPDGLGVVAIVACAGRMSLARNTTRAEAVILMREQLDHLEPMTPVFPPHVRVKHFRYQPQIERAYDANGSPVEGG